ncbi:unnamed protein product [Didymodactylos carnosus]|uniref:Uncharacterized protein n=1 Tax=Didymodactylos carnosus TaxID=1234261 RepID=A0A814KZ04_9BILA|nr:unnamed protein product [Didymodactylos carnosus]CAF1090125.1 unnamed protein product [Didymodactylos carnosus]CAF3826625.1 unnamed protein product [Didymodactylos carnosus]CAF3851812.1 unnamed protein product [Didymodactylos carnosus]
MELLRLSIIWPILLVYATNNHEWLFYSTGRHRTTFDCLTVNNLVHCRRRSMSDTFPKTCYNYTAGTLTFSILKLNNITAKVLPDWLFPLDVADRYAQYLQNSEIELINFIYNYSQGYVGSTCHHERFYQEQCVSNLLNEQIHNPLQRLREFPVCFIDIKCNRGLMCLDGRNICDGIPECDNAIDNQTNDKAAIFLSINECEMNE